MNLGQGFLESIITLALTAATTGFLIPYIFKRIDERKLREQKRYEAEIARQAKIIESQVQLLENMAQLLWEYQLAAIAPSYYDPVAQQDLYALAVKQYQEKTGSLFSKIRAEISKALRLTSSGTYEELKNLYYERLLPLDVRLNGLIKAQKVGEKRVDGWRDFNSFAVFQLSEIVDKALNNLARELRLKGGDAEQKLNAINVD